ncbi:MAG: PilX N-terminal domain-containing pilus assembly protein [Gemmatimonadota bacterium]
MDQRGMALPLAILLLLALCAVVAGAAEQSLTGTRVARNLESYQRAFGAAEGALDHGLERLVGSYEQGNAPADSALLATGRLGGFDYTVRVSARREPGVRDLNGNGVLGETVRYSRAWGYSAAAAAGTSLDPGEPVRRLRSSAWGTAAAEDLVLEVALERDPAVADPSARGAWRAIPLRWSALIGHR